MFRTGTKVFRTVYDGDRIIAVTVGADEEAFAVARRIVDAMNSGDTIAGVAMRPASVLARHVAYFDKHVALWSQSGTGRGKFALVVRRGDGFDAGFFETEQDALAAGYAITTAEPFLVRRVPVPGEEPPPVATAYGFSVAAGAPMAKPVPDVAQPASCRGEICTMCGLPARHKVAEEILSDDLVPHRHGLSAYVCAMHFMRIVKTEPR